jgi:FkbM family methyltransferase
VTRKGSVSITNDGLSICGTADNAIWTSSDVLCLEDYHFSGTGEDYVCIDIGTNIGIAALYLAQNEKIKHIYGFEPFEATYRQAENNVKNNPALADKISVYNCGLGKKNEMLSLHYHDELNGQNSTVIDKFVNSGKPRVSVEIKRASEALKPIIEKHQEAIMLKIDCEGAEFDILPDLADAGLLKKIKIIIMEWHFTRPDSLIDLLNTNGFVVFRNNSMDCMQGIIRAVLVKC